MNTDCVIVSFDWVLCAICEATWTGQEIYFLPGFSLL